MGQKFVTVLREPDGVLDTLREMTIVDVRKKSAEMQKMFRGQPLYFLGRKELHQVFKLNDRQVMECIKVFSVHNKVIRIGCVDFFGALALAASGASDEKIGFCFKLMDANRDDYLSTNEMVILLICITRGLARLKGFDVIPEEILDGIVMTAFQNERKKLNSHGEISVNSFIGFCLANDLTRGYLASIGAKVPPVDAQALVLKRSHALKQLAEVRFRIDETLHQIEEVYAHSSAMDDREGDLPFLKLFEGSTRESQDETGSQQQTNNSTIQSSASPLIKPSMKRIPSHTFSHTNSILGSLPPESSTYASTQQEADDVSVISTYQSETDMLLALPASHPVKRYLLEEDTWKNEVYRIKKASAISVGNGIVTLPDDELFRYIFTKQFEADLYKQWRRLPHDEDDLALVDELTLVALFQQCSVVISVAFARACLLDLVPSQCKKYFFKDILRYFRHNCLVYRQRARRECYPWYRIVSSVHDRYSSWRRWYSQLMDLIMLQRKVLTGLVRVEELNVAKKLADFRNLISSTPSVMQFKHIINGERIRSIRKRSQTPGTKPNTPANNDEDNAGGTFPVRLQLSMSTVPFTNISTKRPRDSSRLRVVNNPDGSAELTIFDMGALQATDILDYFNLQSEKKFYEEEDRRRRQEAEQGKDDKILLESMLGKKLQQDSPTVYQSAVWTLIEPGTVDLSQMVLLRCALKNALRSVPVHTRSTLYSHCFVELCTIGDTGGARKSKRKSTLMHAIESALGQKPTKIILVALLHTDDHFVDEEKKLVQSDLFVSRSVLSANVELKSIHTFEDLYAMSLDFVNYENKLYGPQEDELGDLTNPLQFAKEMRQQKKEIGALLQGLQEKSKEELQEVCRKLGLRDICKYKKELVERLQPALSFKKEIIGHGELSHFGKQIIAKMFMRSKIPMTFNNHGNNTPAYSDQSVEEVIASSLSKYNENGLSLWEFNKYLGTLQAKTMYDKAAYKFFLEDQQVLVNRDEQLLLPGLFLIYEKLGHLADDNQYWNIGSFDEMFAGTLQFQCNIEPEAFKSLLNLLPDSPRLYMPKLFAFFQRLGGIKQCEADMELDGLSELIELLPWDVLHMEDFRDKLVEMCKKPGYFAEFFNSFVSYLNDIDVGPLRTLRTYVADLFADSVAAVNVNEQLGDDQPPTFEDEEKLFSFQEAFISVFSKQVEEILMKAYEEKPLYMPTTNSGEKNIAASGAAVEGADGDGSMVGIAVAKSDTLASDNADNPPPEEERLELPRTLENIRIFGDKVLNMSLYEESARATLPCMVHSSIIDYYKMKIDIIGDIEFLQKVRETEKLTLSLEESIAIDSRKELLEKALQEVLHIIDEQDKQLPAHILAAYDALRIFGKGINSLGLGSKDITVRLNVEGINLLEKLPAGLGEVNDIQRLNDEKNERYAHRRQAALAAIERERLRRAMTDEDYERIKQEKLRKERLFYEAQDKMVYDEAIRKLYESREEKKTMAELGQIVKLFEEFFKRKQSRGGGGIDSIIAKNNIACVMVEVYGVEHPLSQPAQYFLQEAVEALPEVLDDLKDAETPTVTAGSKDGKQQDGESVQSGKPDDLLTADQSNQQGGDEDVSLEDNASEIIEHAAIKALISLNYIDILIRTQSFTNLRNCMPVKEFMLNCVGCMSDKEKEKLQKSVVPAYRGIQVLHTSLKHDLLLQAIIQEVALITSNLELLHLLPSTSSLADELSHAISLRSKEKSILEEDDQSLSSAQTKTSAQLRKEKRQKYQEQRSKDNKIRQEASRQRKILYDLVHTDKISEIFASKARAGAANIKTLWGGDSDGAELEKEQALFDEMAHAMANQHLDPTNQTAGTALGSSVGTPSSPSGSASTLSKPK